METLRQKFHQHIAPALKQELGYRNVWQVPRLEKVVVSVGLGQGLKDAKFAVAAVNTLRRITGQKPVETLAKQSIANFKIRQGQVVGLKVTLRGERMFDFLQKLVQVTLPRVRDFRGLDPQAVDRNGNVSIGVKENLPFPEISADEVERMHGVEVTVVTTARSREDGLALLRCLGLPFRASSARPLV